MIRFRPTFDVLEDRACPTIGATLLAGTSGMFTDSDGDLVQVVVGGTAGTATFNDGAGVADGQEIAKIVVSGASPDFRLTFFDHNQAGGNIVSLGEISSIRPIRGIFTVPYSGVPRTEFVLTSFSGRLSAEGRIYVDRILGDWDMNLALNLIDGLGPGREIHVSGNIEGHIDVSGTLAGTLAVGGSISGEWWIYGAVAGSARVYAGGGIEQMYVEGPCHGQISNVASLYVYGAIGSKARITATEDGIVGAVGAIRSGSFITTASGSLLVYTYKSFAGIIDGGLASSVRLSMSGHFLRTGRIDAEGTAVIIVGAGGTPRDLAGEIHVSDLSLSVGRDVLSSARIQASTVASDPDVNGIDVARHFAGRLSVSGVVDALDIGGDILETAVLTVGFLKSDVQWAGRLLGRLSILSDLQTNLTVGAVAGKKGAITVAGFVLADVDIAGKLRFFSSASAYKPDTGEFINGNNEVTGTLTVGGAIGTVLPLAWF